MNMIRLWGVSTPRSMRPIWLAEELGLQYQLEPIRPRTGETKTADYTALNRKQKIPFMADRDIRLSESLAICRYLLATYPNDNVYLPDTPSEKAKDDEWCCYLYGEIDETGLYVMRRHGDLAQIYGESEAAVESSRAYVSRHFEVIAHRLAESEYLTDTGFALPDLLLMTCLDWAIVYQVPMPEALMDYHASIAQRPAYQRAMKINYPELFGGGGDGTT